MAQNPIVTITMENGGVIKAELYPEVAPVSVNNFISLVLSRIHISEPTRLRRMAVGGVGV